MRGGVAEALHKAGEAFVWDQDAMEALIARMEPRIRDAFVRAILIARQENTLGQLAELAESGQLMDALDKAATAGARNLSAMFNTVLIESGQAVASALSEGLTAVVSFDQVNTRAVSAMQENQVRLIREFVQEQRAATRDALIDGIRRGLNPREQARNFRDSIGLTQRQQQAVINYRRLLTEGNAEALQRKLRDRRFDSTVARAVRGEAALSQSQIDRMVERYGERYVKYRSEVIARTEALRSVHEGTHEMFRQAIDNGTVEQDSLEQMWNTARDERVRDSHNTMNEQVQTIDAPFVSGNGNLLRFPGDVEAPADETIQCRCVVTTRVVKL